MGSPCWCRGRVGKGRSPGEGNGNPPQYSCLENPMDRGAWQATVHGVAKSQTWLIDWTHTHTHTHFNTKGNFFLGLRGLDRYQVFLLFHSFPYLIVFLQRMKFDIMHSWLCFFLVFLLHCNPSGMPHTEKQFGIDFHVVESEYTLGNHSALWLWVSTGPRLRARTHGLAWVPLFLNVY